MKKMSDFLCENFQILVGKFSIYLTRLVFVMVSQILHKGLQSSRRPPQTFELLYSVISSPEPKAQDESQRLKVSFCDRPSSVMCRLLCVFRGASSIVHLSTFYLKEVSS